MRVWMMEELLDLQVRFMGLRERVEAGDEQAARDAVELLRAMQAAAIEAGLGEGSAKGTKA
jgi:hypothetical protein